MAIGDIYELIDIQILAGQQVLNVYHYKQLADPTIGTPIAALEGAFYTFIQSLAMPAQSTSLAHLGYRVTNLDNPDEFDVLVSTETGQVAGDCLPPFCAWAFRLNRATRSVRNGQKRVGGVPEAFQVNGVETAAAEALLVPLGIAMGAIITEPVSGGSFQPRILHKATEAGPGGVPPATPRADYAISSGQYTRLSTQNTRKFGRGA